LAYRVGEGSAQHVAVGDGLLAHQVVQVRVHVPGLEVLDCFEEELNLADKHGQDVDRLQEVTSDAYLHEGLLVVEHGELGNL
jgi:hypothetical protein